MITCARRAPGIEARGNRLRAPWRSAGVTLLVTHAPSRPKSMARLYSRPNVPDAGITGWGEMLKDDAKACAAGAHEVARYLVGQDPRRIAHHWQAIHRGAFYKGGPIKTAISSGIDQALWDITGKCYGVPVYKLLGGPTRDRVRVYRHLQGTTAGAMIEDAHRFVEQGFTALRYAPLAAFERRSCALTFESVEVPKDKDGKALMKPAEGLSDDEIKAAADFMVNSTG